jgi:hypothetical protein
MNPRKAGGQKQTLREFNMSAINQMLVYIGVATNPSKECPSKTWIPLAKTLSKWKQLVFKRRKNRLDLKQADTQQSTQERQYPDPPPTSPSSEKMQATQDSKLPTSAMAINFQDLTQTTASELRRVADWVKSSTK